MTVESVMKTIGDVALGATFQLPTGAVCLRGDIDPAMTPSVPAGWNTFTRLSDGSVMSQPSGTPCFIIAYKAVPE